MSIIRLNSPTKLTRTLLWTNPNPSQEFAAQRVNVPTLNTYEEIWVYVKLHNSYANDNRTRVVTRAGCTINAQWLGFTASYSFAWIRQIGCNQNSIDFADAFTKNLLNTSAAYMENARLVPYQVYGVNYS